MVFCTSFKSEDDKLLKEKHRQLKESYMSRYSVSKPITVLMGTLIIIVLGLFSLIRLPLTLFPEINLPFVVTITSYPGASPETIQNEISEKIEAAVSTISNFDTVSSNSNENFAISFITFQDGTNLDSVTVELREIINNLEFVEGVGNTSILRLSPDLLPVMDITMYRTFEQTLSDEQALIFNTEWINEDILNRLKSIPGVADVSLTGVADVVLEVNLNEAALNTYGLSEAQVLSIINEQNEAGLIGVALDEGDIRLLYVASAPESLFEVESLPIIYFEDTIVTLSMLSDNIGYVNNAAQSYSKVNGEQGIQISFQKQSDVGITEVTDRILLELDDIVNDSPYEVTYEVLLNQGEFINQSINSVFQNLLIGAAFAIVVLFLFLRDIKPTIIVGLAIPISVVAAFMLMYFSNVSLNIISMGGLALGIGMLVDNAVVVIENIYRMLLEGKSKTEAAIEGAKEVAGAITASTITTAAVFLPIFFIEGVISEIFISMALTIAYSLGASLLIALTLVPSMASRYLSEKNVKKESKFGHAMKVSYKYFVKGAIRFKLLTLLLIFGLLAGSTYLVVQKGFILIPGSDEGTINVNINFSSTTEFDTKTAFADALTEIFLDIDDVETVSATLGGGFVFGPPQAQGSGGTLAFTINLKSSRNNSTEANLENIETRIIAFDVNDIEGLSSEDVIEIVVSSQDSTAGAFGATGINIKVSGNDLLKLENISNDLVDILRTIDGVEDPDGGISVGADRIIVTVNKEEAMMVGLTNQDVIDNLNYLFNTVGNIQSSESVLVTLEGNLYELVIPVETTGGIALSDFGTYEQFLGNIHLFDDDIRALIDAYTDNYGQGIYVPNLVLPTFVEGDQVEFIINPFIQVLTDENGDPTEIVPGMGMGLPLETLAITTLKDDTQTIVTLEKATGFATINTDGSSRYLEVTADISDDFNVTLVSAEVTEAVEAYMASEVFEAYGGGYDITFAGENEEIQALFGDLALGLIVAILIVYMVMAIQFQSLVYPFIILGTIPLAFTGGMIAILVTGSNLSLVALVGFVILVGIVVNNGIVLIDYINQLRLRGLTVMDAIIEAGQTRLRPIFMTALTTILGLLVLALGIGEGSELLQPLAIVSIGGLLYATVLTLIFVPMIYAMFNRKTIKKELKKAI
jgi:multidrug efflux pump subunit AcrB